MGVTEDPPVASSNTNSPFHPLQHENPTIREPLEAYYFEPIDFRTILTLPSKLLLSPEVVNWFIITPV